MFPLNALGWITRSESIHGDAIQAFAAVYPCMCAAISRGSCIPDFTPKRISSTLVGPAAIKPQASEKTSDPQKSDCLLA